MVTTVTFKEVSNNVLSLASYTQLPFFCTGGDAMCAESAQVILCYLKVSHRPGESERQKQPKPKTQTRIQKTETNNLAPDTTQVGHAEVKQIEKVKQGVSN